MKIKTIELRAYGRDGKVLGTATIPLRRDTAVTVEIAKCAEDNPCMVIAYATAVVENAEFMLGVTGEYEIAYGGTYSVEVPAHLIREVSASRQPTEVVGGKIVEVKRDARAVITKL